MISFLQNILQKHHKWLFSILLVIIVVAFVFTIGAAPGIGNKRMKHRYFYGYDLNDRKMMDTVAENVMYSAILNKDDIAMAKHTLNIGMLRRMMLLGLADSFNVPLPSNETLSSYTRSLPVFLDEDGNFSADIYGAILEMFNRTGAGEDRLKQVLCEHWRIQCVENAIIGKNDYINHQLEQFISEQYTEYDFSVLSIKNNIKSDSIQISKDEIEREFGDNPTKYQQPEMFAVSMIKFDNSQFISQVQEPTDDLLLEYFNANREKFSNNAKLEDIKDTVRDSYIKSESIQLSAVAADNFVHDLYDDNVLLNSDSFNELLKKYNTQKEPVALYSRKKLPVVNGVNPRDLLMACNLDDERYFSDPCQTTFGACVLILEGKKPSRTLNLQEATSAIRELLSHNKKQQQFADHIEHLRQRVQNGDIENVCKEDGITRESFQNISLAHVAEQEIDPLYIRALASLNKNDKIRIMALNDDEVLLFCVTDVHERTISDLNSADVISARNTLCSSHNQFWNSIFLENQLQKIK